ncbi:MAG: SdrD B-like domain-containing protein, partial [Saprospiraceae bacterium]
MMLYSNVYSQSATKGNTFVHGGKEMTIFGAHNFTNGGSGLMPGIVGTKRNNPTFLSFSGNASIAGVTDASHADGYVKNYNIPVFTYPTGDNGIYGPVKTEAASLPNPISAAYYFANPNTAITSSLLGGNEVPLPSGAPFSTSSLDVGLMNVSNIEYWDINGSTPVKITLYWKALSQINALTTNALSTLRLAGWDGSKWVQIPASIDPGSNFGSGSITSTAHIAPDTYNVYTFAAAPCHNNALLTVGDLQCLGSDFQVGFLTNGVNPMGTAGVISGNQLINIPIGTNVSISADNGMGCLNSISISGPAQCPATCIMPLLSVGQAVCDGVGANTYSVSYAELTGAQIAINAGILYENSITNIPMGTNLTITASNGLCNYSFTIKSPANCLNLCELPRMSISGPQCVTLSSSYTIHFATVPNALIISDQGIVGSGQVSGIPSNTPCNITVRYPGCADQTMRIEPPTCRNTASIGDLVWHDLNGDGQQSIGEPGISGLQINLFRSDGAFIASAFTDLAGKYIFDNMYPGYYFLQFKKPTGYEQTLSNRGSNLTDSDVNNSNGPGTTVVFLLSPGAKYLSLDAGYYKCVPIGDLVWYDINKNDVWDAHENGINSLRVNLWQKIGSSWSMVNFTYTGQKPGSASDDGYFNFCAAPGEYFVEVVMPPLGLVRARPNIGTNEEFDSDIRSDGKTEPFVVNSGDTKTDIGAGFYPMATAGNLVWSDSNLNGIQEANEPTVSGVKVEAIDLTTGAVVSTTSTDANGTYHLEYLEKQQYFMRFSPPSGYGATVPRATVDELDSDVDHSHGPNTTRAFY